MTHSSTSAAVSMRNKFSSGFKFLSILLFVLLVSGKSWGQTLYDTFSDGNFTASPVWGGNTTLWTIQTSSDAAAGATNSFTLRSNSSSSSTSTDYLSSQIGTWGDSQEWDFFMGRRAQAYTAANQQYFWLYANESTLNNATVDGYRIAIGDDSGGDELRLEYIVNGVVSSTVITSSGSLTNGLTDIGFLVRVTRSATGVWTLYTSTLPTTTGTGAIATNTPSASTCTVNQGSATNNTIVPATNGYLGVAQLHSTGANALITSEFDQIYFTPTSVTSSDATLLAMTLSAGTLSPTFASGTIAYTATVPYSISSITVTPTKTDANATIQVQVNSGGWATVASGSTSSALPLTAGTTNTVDVKVTAQDGTTTKTYTTTVTRTAVATVSTLSNLVLSAGTLSPTFASGTTSYTASVPYTTGSITVTPTKTNSFASIQVQVNGGGYSSVTSGSPSSSLSLNAGASNTIDVKVTAEDNSTTTYTTTVTRAAVATDATLSALTTTAGALTPTFDAGTTSYTASVDNATASVTVTPTKTNTFSTIQVRVNSGTYNTVTSGSPSGSLALNEGNNPIDVKVTAQDGATIQTYTITVNRAAAVSATISTLGTLSAVSTTYGTASSTTSFSLSGSSMNAGITVTPPAGFEVSTTSDFTSNVGNNASPITIGAAGSISSTTVYVRLKATATVAGSPYSGNIVLSSSGASTVNVGTASSTVSTYQLSVSGLSGVSKIYDGTTVATLNGVASLSSTVNSDVISLAGTASGAFSTPSVGTTKTITITGLSLAGTNSTSYSLATATTSANITTKALTMSGLSVPASKTYDGGTIAVVSGTATLQSAEAPGAGSTNDGKPYTGDAIIITGTATGTYNDANVANASTVTFSGLSLTGGNPGNYTLTIQPPASATITKADQIITLASTATNYVGVADYSPATSTTNTITYTSSNTAAATILNNKVHLVGAGTTTITASQAGSDNYNAATDVTQDLTVILNTSYYKSVATGDWNTLSTWISSPDGSTNWAAATSVPGPTNSVTIQSTDVVTVSDVQSCKDLTVKGSTAGSITVNGSLSIYGTLNADASPGADCVGGTGYIILKGSGTVIGSNWSASAIFANLFFDPGTGNASNFSKNLKFTDNIIIVSGTVSTTAAANIYSFNAPAALLVAFGATLDLSAFTCSIYGSSTSTPINSVTIGGTLITTSYVNAMNFTIQGGGTFKTSKSSNFYNGAVIPTVTCDGTYEANGVAQTIPSTTAYNFLKLSNSGTKTLASNILINGTLTLGGSATLSLSTYNLTYGSSAILEYTTPTTYRTTNNTSELKTVPSIIKINSTNPVNLGQSLTIDGTLDLTQGRLTTMSNILTIGASGSIINASSTSFVNGNLKKIIASGTTTKTFEVGFGITYAPVSIDFIGTILNSDGSIQVSTTAGDHAQISTSGLATGKSVNRTWTISNPTAITGMTSYSPTFNYVAGDIDAGATTANFVVKEYSSSAWSGLTTGTKTSTSTQATGVTTFGDFAIGELKTNPTISVSGSQSFVYSGSAQGPASITYNGDGTTSLTYTSTDGAGYSSATPPTNAGVYQVIADATMGANYNSASSSAYAFTIYPATSTFSKNGSSNWSTATEWTYTPLPATDLVISSGELIVDQNTTVNTITVNPGAKLTLGSGVTLTVGTLTLQSDVTGTATFVDDGGTLNATTSNVQQYLTSGRNWYISSPVSGATSAVFDAANSTNKLYWYDEVHGSTTAWPQITNNTTSINVMQGYVTNQVANGVVTFTGTLNTGAKSINISRTTGQASEGFNLIGNPYPCYLDWDKVSKANVSTSLWHRTKNNGGIYVFDTYNSTSQLGVNNSGKGINNHIPPMQAFWVRVNTYTGLGTPPADYSNVGVISVDNTMTSHKGSQTTGLGTVIDPAFKSKSVVNSSLLRLQVSNGTNSDEAILYSNPNASNSYDEYDSPKMFSNSTALAEIYTVANSENLAINGLNTIPYDTEIALGFSTLTAGNYSLKASQISNFETGTQIILKDYLNPSSPVVADLSDGSNYSFSSGATSNNTSRFTLIFRAPSVATGLNLSGIGNGWISTNANGQLMINGALTGETSVTVYNAVGQRLASKNLTSNVSVIDTRLVPGIYTVAVTNAGRTATTKMVVK